MSGSDPVLPATDRSDGAKWPFVSVVICVYTEKRWDDITAAARSVLEQTYCGPVEVLIVVDHNESLFARLQMALPEARVIESTGARGLAGGRNTGIAAAAGEVIAFLDDDAYAEPGWLAELVMPYDEEDVIATGGRILPHWPASRPRWLPPEFDWVVGCSYRGLPEKVSDVRNLIGANMSFRASALAQAGPFSEGLGRIGTLPLGCEETEICIRARREIPGSKVLHVPDAVVHHRVAADRLTPRYFFHRCWSEGLSKAAVAGLVGSDAALASERRYMAWALPSGAMSGVRDAVGGDIGGLMRCAFIISGLFVTVAGYLRGRRRFTRRVVPGAH